MFKDEEVPEEDARKLAKSFNAEFGMASALTGDGVEAIFKKVVEKYSKKPPKIEEVKKEENKKDEVKKEQPVTLKKQKGDNTTTKEGGKCC